MCTKTATKLCEICLGTNVYCDEHAMEFEQYYSIDPGLSDCKDCLAPISASITFLYIL
jgi:hypothetical protein